MKIQGPLDVRALRVLREIPGIEAKHAPRGLLIAGGERLPITVFTHRRVGSAEAWELVRHSQRERMPLVAVVDRTTIEARDILTRHDVGFVDGLGNANLALPGLLVRVQAKREPNRIAVAESEVRLAGKAGLAAQAILLDVGREWHVKDLAREAGISIGLAHRLLGRLEREGILEAIGAGPRRVRRVVNEAALLDCWAKEMVDRSVERTLAFKLARTPRALGQAVGSALGESVPYALTGAAAAALLAPFVTAIPVTEVWVTAAVPAEDILATAGAEPVPDGADLVLLQARDDMPLAFRTRLDHVWIASPPRIYRDLLQDPRRGREQAEFFRHEVIRF